MRRAKAEAVGEASSKCTEEPRHHHQRSKKQSHPWLEKALEALGDYSGPEVDGLKHALAKGKESASELPVDVQISKCKEFTARSEKRVAKLEAERVPEVASLEEGRARLLRLAQSVSQRAEVNMAPDDTEAELARLPAQVAVHQAKCCHREASSETVSGLRKCRASNADFGARRAVGVDGRPTRRAPRSRGIWRQPKSSHVQRRSCPRPPNALRDARFDMTGSLRTGSAVRVVRGVCRRSIPPPVTQNSAVAGPAHATSVWRGSVLPDSDAESNDEPLTPRAKSTRFEEVRFSGREQERLAKGRPWRARGWRQHRDGHSEILRPTTNTNHGTVESHTHRRKHTHTVSTRHQKRSHYGDGETRGCNCASKTFQGLTRMRRSIGSGTTRQKPSCLCCSVGAELKAQLCEGDTDQDGGPSGMTAEHLRVTLESEVGSVRSVSGCSRFGQGRSSCWMWFCGSQDVSSCLPTPGKMMC